jgi:alpha-N-arabinofuranosidase
MKPALLSALAALVFSTSGTTAAKPWAPAGARIKTQWAAQVSPDSPLPEYPRPRLVRDTWQNLNGQWDYAITPKGAARPAAFDGKILVPFAVESSLSGVQREVGPDKELWYEREFTLSAGAAWKNKKILLHFDAVDWRADVYINNTLADSYTSGYTPFSFDITNYIKPGAPPTLTLPNPVLWSPDTPKLYDLRAALKSNTGAAGDEFRSYAAFRKISAKRAAAGHLRLQLNNRDLFQFGPLDQGWWPDGLYTAPTDEALLFDIIKTKELGFNMIRKHVKVEPQRWYWHCDREGVLVWQDMPSTHNYGLGAKWANNDPGVGIDTLRTPMSKANYYKEWGEIMDFCKGHPSVVVWVPFNEAWGQFDTAKVAKWTKECGVHAAPAALAHWDFTTAAAGTTTGIAPDTAAVGVTVAPLVWFNESVTDTGAPVGVVTKPHAATRLTAGMAQGTFDGRAYEIPTTATTLGPVKGAGPQARGASGFEFTVKAAPGHSVILNGLSFSLGYTTTHTGGKNYLSPTAALFMSTDAGATFNKIGRTEFPRTDDSKFFDRKTGYTLRKNIALALSAPLALTGDQAAVFRLVLGEDKPTSVHNRRYLVDDIILTGTVTPPSGKKPIAAPAASAEGASLAKPAASASASYNVTVDVSALAVLGDINPDIYGQFIEHVELKDECIYPAIWDDTNPLSDAAGLRRDVIAAARALNVPVIRWPGGCFADVYHWEDGIGPRAARQPKPNTHWKTDEPNKFGTDEFLNWSNQIGARQYININLGTGTLDEALRWLEYCNGAPGTPQGKRRAANGHPAPYNVPYWGIGNETWAKWEAGDFRDPKKYAAALAEWAAAFRKQDPNIKIIAVGSSSGKDQDWDDEVVKTAGRLIDYLTLHHYGRSNNYTGDEYETVVYNQPADYDYCLRRMLHHIDTAARAAGLKNQINISMDEWNIRHYQDGVKSRKTLLRKDPRNLQDALFAAGVLNVMLRLSPRVGMANYVFLVNGHAPLLVNEKAVVKTPLFYLFQQYARWMQGRALTVSVTGPTIAIPPARMPNPAVPKSDIAPVLDTTAALNVDGSIALALVNRHQTAAARVTLALPPGLAPAEAWTLTAADIYDKNTFENPNTIIPKLEKAPAGVTAIKCPPHSIMLLRCTAKK